MPAPRETLAGLATLAARAISDSAARAIFELHFVGLEGKGSKRPVGLERWSVSGHGDRRLTYAYGVVLQFCLSIILHTRAMS